MKSTACSSVTHTPERVARRFSSAFRSRFFFDPIARVWFEWSAAGWRQIETAKVLECAKEIAREFAEGAEETLRSKLLDPRFVDRVEVFARQNHCSTSLARRRVKPNGGR